MPTSKPKIYTICVLILLSGMALSLGFYFSLENSNQLKRDKILTNLYGNIHSNIQREIDRNLNSLYALRASYQAYGGWNRQEFGRYASYYTSHINSIQALEWVPAIRLDQRDSFELATQKEGFEGFQIFSRTNGEVVRAEERAVYYPVYFIEPFADNEAAFGFDPGAFNESRQKAIEQAITTNQAAGSDIITIIQKTNPHNAILVFVPIFSDESNEKLIGLVEGVYLMDKLVDAALIDLDLPSEVNLVISNQNSSGKKLLGTSLPNTGEFSSRESLLTIADQTWVLRLEYLGAVASQVISPFWLLIASLIFTLLIVKVVYDVLTDNQRRLLKHVVELRRKNHDLEQYTYAASHDLQEPLHSIQSLVGLIHQDYNDQIDDIGKTYLHHINEASQRMSELITNLLRYSHIGKTEKQMWTNSKAVLEKVVNNLDADLQKNNGTIHIKTELPIVMAYPASLEQLLHNLIANGLKFQSPNNHPIIEISTKKLKGEVWQFIIKDNGIGFSEEFIGRIFTIFKTLHSRSIYPGSGFGLANCKKIVELHNGKIWAKSKPGSGSTFFFTLNLT